MKKHRLDGAHARARTLRRTMNAAERRVWQTLCLHQMHGYKFRRQVTLGRYIADFVCHEARLIVEIDGGQHDQESSREVTRSAFLKSEGCPILRFWNNEVLSNLEGVHRTISEELHRSPPPSPIEGEGVQGHSPQALLLDGGGLGGGDARDGRGAGQ